MRTRYRVLEPDAPHFITSTVVGWLPVFTNSTRCDVLVQSFEHCRRHKDLKLFAWVIMDSHFHAVIAAPDLTRTVADLKKFVAHRILEDLAREGSDWLLREFAGRRARHKTASAHQFWQEGFHPQAILSDTTMEQKIAYLHANPVRRGLVALAEHWRYSSAHALLPATVPVIRCDPWR